MPNSLFLVVTAFAMITTLIEVLGTLTSLGLQRQNPVTILQHPIPAVSCTILHASSENKMKDTTASYKDGVETKGHLYIQRQ